MYTENIIWNNCKWTHISVPTKTDINKIRKKYEFHEIIESDILESNTQDKIDVYDDYLFVVLHFPKYKANLYKYVMNEFEALVWRDFIITISQYNTRHIEEILKYYESNNKESVSPNYILFKIIDKLYDKTINIITKSNKDIIEIEDQLFTETKNRKHILEKLMIKKRNIIFLKYLYKSQVEVLWQIQDESMKFYKEEFDVYFEDLSYKLDKIINQINVQFENVKSLADTYNSLMNIQINSLIKVLTLFTAIVWTLTMITWIYWMNLILPFQDNKYWFFIVWTIMIGALIWMIMFFRKNDWL